MTAIREWGSKTISDTNDHGFSMLEVVLLLFVLGVVLQAAMPHFKPDIDGVRNKVQAANIKRIEGAAQIYRLDVGVYPVRVEDLIEPPPGISGWQGPYLDFMPRNPFDSSLSYQIDSLGQAH